MSDLESPLIAGLRLDDVASVVGEAMKDQRRAILAHVNRLHELHRSELKAAAGRDEDTRVRVHQLFMRVTEIESQLRRLRRSGALPR